MRSVIDPMDRNTWILFSDARVASHWNSEKCEQIKPIILGEDGSGYEDIMVPHGGCTSKEVNEQNKRAHFLDGQKIFKNAVTKMTESIREILKKNKLSLNEIDWSVPHQANLGIIVATGNNLEVESKKVLTNLHKFGNTTNAYIPLCLCLVSTTVQVGQQNPIVLFRCRIYLGKCVDGVEVKIKSHSSYSKLTSQITTIFFSLYTY